MADTLKGTLTGYDVETAPGWPFTFLVDGAETGIPCTMDANATLAWTALGTPYPHRGTIEDRAPQIPVIMSLEVPAAP